MKRKTLSYFFTLGLVVFFAGIAVPMNYASDGPYFTKWSTLEPVSALHTSVVNQLQTNKVVDVQMQCNTMVGVFEVDPVAARAVLPVQYELALQPNGKALVYLQASNCDGDGNGEPL